jgi:hypothetical protein
VKQPGGTNATQRNEIQIRYVIYQLINLDRIEANLSGKFSGGFIESDRMLANESVGQLLHEIRPKHGDRWLHVSAQGFCELVAFGERVDQIKL